MRHREYLLPYAILVLSVFFLWFALGRDSSALFPHFDKILHLLGGASCGIFGAWLYFASGPHDHSRAGRQAMIHASAVSVVLVVGVFIWEGLQIFWTPMITGPFDLVDTLGDIVADFLGAATAAFVYCRKLERREHGA